MGGYIRGWAAAKWSSHPLFAPIVHIGGGVFIRRGEVDRSSLQEAIDANAGRMIFIPGGEYVIDRSLRITADNTGLYGYGTVVQTNPEEHIVEIYRESEVLRGVRIIGLTFRRAEGGTVLAIEVLDARTGESLWRGTIQGPPDGQPGVFSEDEVRGEMDALMTFLEERLGLDLPEVRSP